MKKIISSIFCFATLLAMFSCETLSIDEKTVSTPVIESFTPKAAPVGAEVVIYGDFLNDVTSASIGGVAVEIIEKVSNSRMSVRVGEDVNGGKIVLENPKGKGESSEAFTCTFAVPEITAASVVATIDMGSELLLAGSHLNSARSVEFYAAGYDKAHEAVILNQSDDEIVVKVPYVEAEDAVIVMTYFDGAEVKSTDRATAPATKVIKYIPAFDEYEFVRTTVGTQIELTGQYLNNIEKILFGETEAEFTAAADKIVITVPEGEFVDGPTEVKLQAVYFEGNETKTLKEDFIVYVPYIKIWKDKTTVCQARWDESPFTAFFSPETGRVYENKLWETELDPVAVTYKNIQWGSANIPKPGVVSDEEYNSVIPYFFFSAGASDKAVTLQSPANSNGQLKNIYCENDSKTSITGKNNWTGTPILGYKVLDKASENEAEVKLYNDIITGDPEDIKIDETTFRIDIENNTLGGIAAGTMSGASSSCNKSKVGWCVEKFDDFSDAKDYRLDVVILVAYYTNCGYSAETPLANIKRLGIIHLKEADWGIENSATYGRTFLTFNCYWQKRDYDYSKLAQ